MHNEEHYERLRQALRIDPMRIDEDLIELPPLLQEAGEFTAEAARARDRAEFNLKTTLAEVADAIRTDPDRPKQPSEAEIDKRLPMDKEVIDAQEKLVTAKYEFSMWMSVVEGLRSKGDSLKTTANLIVSGYVSSGAAYSDRRRELHEKRQNRKGASRD